MIVLLATGCVQLLVRTVPMNYISMVTSGVSEIVVLGMVKFKNQNLSTWRIFHFLRP